MVFIFLCASIGVAPLSSKSKSPPTRNPTAPQSLVSSQKSLLVALHKCFTPNKILDEVACRITPNLDPTGTLSSLTLVRLSKQLISLDNGNKSFERMMDGCPQNDDGSVMFESMEAGLSNLVVCLAASDWTATPQSLESAMEGIKACSVVSRIALSNPSMRSMNRSSLWQPLTEKIHSQAHDLSELLQPHQLSGLKWAMDSFRQSDDVDEIFQLPFILQNAYYALDLPFRVWPGFLANCQQRNASSVATLVEQVDFQVEKIRTTSNRVVPERRQTAWQGDEHVPPFQYSGKAMKRHPWSPAVAQIRDRLLDGTSQYYDCCLLNLYDNGGSAMRYHIDPDQGVRWGYETAVVSIGATRRFAFRANTEKSSTTTDPVVGDIKPHTFVLMNGDVTEMFNNCQERFQHCVKIADNKEERAPRVSLVFKKTLANGCV